jgi:hypothetical protein
MFGHIEMKYAPSLVAQGYQYEQDPKCSGRSREEIDRGQIQDMIVQESPPGLGRCLAALGHQSGDGSLRDLDAQLQ